MQTPSNREIYLYGGTRSAKTFCIVAYIIKRALDAPRSRHLIARYTAVDCYSTVFDQTLVDVTEKVFQDRLDAKKNKLHHELRFDNGSVIVFRGLDGNDRILGSGFNTIFMNEASEVSEDIYIKLWTRLANKSDIIDNKYIIDANPPKKRHWLYKRFVLKLNLETGEPLKEDDINFVSFKMNPADNLDNLDPGYIKSLEMLPEADRLRYLHGEYVDSFGGEVFLKELNLMDAEGRESEIKIPENAPVHAVFDIGQTGAVWIVHFSPDGQRVELVDYMELFSTSCDEITSILMDKKKYNIRTIVLPHDAKAKSMQAGTSVYETFLKQRHLRGFFVEILPRQDKNDAINALRVWFSRMWFNIHTTGSGVDALRNYVYMKSRDDEKAYEKPKHNWASHGADALKYVAVFCGRDKDRLNRLSHKQTINTQLAKKKLTVKPITMADVFKGAGIKYVIR